MRSKASLPPPDRTSDWSSLPGATGVRKMLRAGGQVPTQTVAPASASAFAIANPYPPSSATPATSALLPVKSIWSISGLLPRNRSLNPELRAHLGVSVAHAENGQVARLGVSVDPRGPFRTRGGGSRRVARRPRDRSEEHTSELQSRFDL